MFVSTSTWKLGSKAERTFHKQHHYKIQIWSYEIQIWIYEFIKIIEKKRNNRLNGLSKFSMENILINEKVKAGKSNFQKKVVQQFIRQTK